MTKLFINVGNDISSLTAYETWLGRQVTGVQLHGADKDYNGTDHRNQLADSVAWLANRWKDVQREKVYLCKPNYNVGGASVRNLSQCADGSMNDIYLRQAQNILAVEPGTHPIVVDPAREFNGSWFYAYSTFYGGGDAAFTAFWRHFVDTFRGVSDRFRFMWTSSVGSDQASVKHPMGAYPGNDYVDFWGMDVYWNLNYQTSDPVAAFNQNRDRPWGMAEFETWASAHGKPTRYPEWGIMSSTARPYIELMAQWFADNNVYAQAYWESDGGFPGKLINNRYGDASVAFKEQFSVPDVDPGPAPDPVPDPDPPAVLEFTAHYVDANTDQVVAAVTEGAFLPPLASGSIKLEPSMSIAKARLTLDSHVRTESIAPYALYGDGSGDFYGQPMTEGPKVFTGEILDANNNVIYSKTINFTVGEAPQSTEEQLAEALAQIASLTASLEAVQLSYADAQVEITTLQDALVESESLYEAAQKIITSLQAELATAQADIASLQGQVTSLNNTIASQNLTIQTQQQAIDARDQTIASLQAELARVRAGWSELKAVLEG